MRNSLYDRELEMQLSQLLESIAERWSIDEIREILIQIENKKSDFPGFCSETRH